MPEQSAQSANNVLDSLHRRFVDETYNQLFFESIFKTRDKLATLLIGDESEELFTKSKIVRDGIHDWLEALATVVHTYAGRLIAIIIADPEICNNDNPAQWIRLWLEERLQKHLRQGKLNIKDRARLAWHKRVAAEENGRQACDEPSARCSRIESWLRRVTDDNWPGSPTDSGEPWLAPSWCNEEIWIKLRLKKHGAWPDHLTREQTTRRVHSFENIFAGRLEYVLGVEEDEARITIAQQSPAEPAKRDLARHAVLPIEAKVAPMEVWLGTDRSFADKVLSDLAMGSIEATGPLDALTKASKRYIRGNGTQFNPRSLWQNIQNRKNIEGK